MLVYKTFKTHRTPTKKNASTNVIKSTFVDALGLTQLNWKRPGYTRGRFLLRPMNALGTTLPVMLVYNLCIIILLCILAVYSFDRVNAFFIQILSLKL